MLIILLDMKIYKIKRPIFLLYLFAALLPYAGAIYLYHWYNNKLEKIKTARIIVISKEKMNLMAYDYEGTKCFEAPIACGIGYGNKTRRGDMKTPEGIFHVLDVEDSSTWEHDFADGKGKVRGAYGPIFIRLAIPGQKGIGIHGTHDPNSIGTRASEGCIRLNNNKVAQLAQMVGEGTIVIIETSKADIINEYLQKNEKTLNKLEDTQSSLNKEELKK